MEELKNSERTNKREPDVNGNNSKSLKKQKNGVHKTVKNQILTDDGRVFYPCQFCNKVFPIKKTRASHIRKCPAKEYILSVGNNNESKNRNGAVTEPIKPPSMPDILDAKKASAKIAIQQNIVLNEQVDVDKILSESKSPPIKLTIKRSPSNGNELSNHFTVFNSFVLKEKNDSAEELGTIAKRLENNSVTLIKQQEDIDDPSISEEESVKKTEFVCRECSKEFRTSLELLRHSRKTHKYPKIVMAMSEIKKLYATKDRSECPVCHKPMKTAFQSAFVKHLHTHTNDMMYSCQVCNKMFRRKDHMKAHERRHVIKRGRS